MKKTVLTLIFLLMVNLLGAQTLTFNVGARDSEPIRLFFKRVYADAGLTIEFVERPLLRMYVEISNGLIGAASFLSEDEIDHNLTNVIKLGLEGDALFSSPLFAYVRSSDLASYLTRIDYRGLRILYVYTNKGHERRIRELGAVPTPVPSAESALQMLHSRRGDLILTYPGAFDHLAEQLGLGDSIVLMRKPLAQVRYYHVLSNRYLSFEPKIREALNIHAGELRELLRP